MISIFGPDCDMEAETDAFEEMEHRGGQLVAIAVHGEDAVLSTEYSLEVTESVLRQMAEVIRMARAH